MVIMMTEKMRVRAVVLDWAGTMIDFGSLAPARVFQTVFHNEGVEITVQHAREPMGMAKREHIAAILQIPQVRDEWESKIGRLPSDSDVERLYQKFLPLQLEVILDHCDLIPGALATFRWLRENGIRVASTTGYTREIMEQIVPRASVAGYQPEIVLCAEDAHAGRPAPWLIFECAKRLNIFPMATIVKVDDTIVGVQAGVNAGVWSVGVAESGNLTGVCEIELKLMDRTQADRLRSDAREKLHRAGADFVIDRVSELPTIIEKINRLLASRADNASQSKTAE